jgi:transcriptional regulator with XRE-family HTH domain
MKVRNVTYSEFLEFRVQDVVSSNVKYYIARSGFTAEQLSYKTNLSVATINRLKAGEHLSFKGICALAEALDVDPLMFFMKNESEISEQPLSLQSYT